MEQVHIWLGNFVSADRLQQYMDERSEYYSEENEDKDNIALNEFIADQNATYFDHDFIESFYNPRRTIKSLLSTCSFSESFARPAAKKASELNLVKPNAVIILGASQINNPISAKGDGYELVYIGKFDGNNKGATPNGSQKYNLDLSSRNLTSIPDYVFEQTDLELLNLANNQITELPKTLSNLINLEVLIISNNQIKKLPKFFSRLKNLEVIQASNNLIDEIHEDIVALQRLHMINLTNNRLKSIPNNIGDLISIETLILKNNLIEKLPDSILHLVNLRQLTLSSNKIKELPINSGFFDKIRYFNIDDNDLTFKT